MLVLQVYLFFFCNYNASSETLLLKFRLKKALIVLKKLIVFFLLVNI